LPIAITDQSLGGVKWGHTPTFEIRVFKIAHVSDHMIDCPQRRASSRPTITLCYISKPRD
jgi:hypothetical protein